MTGLSMPTRAITWTRCDVDDTRAIATWDRGEAPDHNASGPGLPYRCVTCAWSGRGETALRHFRDTGHAVRGRDWPESWPDAQFSNPPPFATYAHEQPMPEGGTLAMFTVHGGRYDRSTLSAETLRGLGIRVSER